MKTKNLKKRISLTLIMAIAVSCFCGINAFAFVNGYNSATELGTSAITAYLESASQNDWYKFTLTEAEVPTGCRITLRVPTNCVYNFDLRYREASTRNRPSIISNETFVSASGQRQINKVLTAPGTYFIRVYSQNGTFSSTDSYRINKNAVKNTTYEMSFGSNLPDNSEVDWAICADLAGNYLYKRTFYSGTTSRNYSNAGAFVMTNHTSDNASDFSPEKKPTPAETADAANYIYSGDVLENPRFEAQTGNILNIEDITKYFVEYDQPVVLFLDCQEYLGTTIESATRLYRIIEDVNIGTNTITYYNFVNHNSVTVDYDDFLIDGIITLGLNSTYRGTNIVPATYRHRVQPAYN